MISLPDEWEWRRVRVPWLMILQIRMRSDEICKDCDDRVERVRCGTGPGTGSRYAP